jgi:4-hydroxy-3-polyprenylbenzoate decarboxylase
MKLIVGITGASGAPYVKRFLEVVSLHALIEVVASPTGVQVFSEETGEDLKVFLDSLNIPLHDNSSYYNELASGSNEFDAMLVFPCTMGTLSRISCGISDTLLTRVADVALKERRKLILLTREAPLSIIHLENQLRISKMGGIIFPLSPAFYHKPEEIGDMIDFVVERVCDQLNLHPGLINGWKPGR